MTLTSSKLTSEAKVKSNNPVVVEILLSSFSFIV